QDQILTIDSFQEGDKRRTSFALVDQPDYPIGDLIALTDRIKDATDEEKRAQIANFRASRGGPHQRLYLGRGDDRSVAMRLKDTEGRGRLIIEVAPDGTPAIRFLDESGKIVSALPPS